MSRNNRFPLFIEVETTTDYRPVKVLAIKDINRIIRNGEGGIEIEVEGTWYGTDRLDVKESLEHFAERLNGDSAIALLPATKNVATDETGTLSDRPTRKAECQEVEVKGIREYTAAALMLEIQEESLAPVDDIGFVPDTTNTTVSVCVRHNGDRTDCRISHLESKDGHIAIVCDAEEDE